jgi:hypothetical protein
MGINSSKETVLGPKYLDPNQEKYIMRHILTELQIRSGYNNKISLIYLHEYFDIPVHHY